MLISTGILGNFEGTNGENVCCELLMSVRFIKSMWNAGFTLLLSSGRRFWVIDIVVVNLVPSDIVVRANICNIVETDLVHPCI